MLFQHLGFVHCPIREHCPAFPNCMDALIVRILATKAHRFYILIINYFHILKLILFKGRRLGTVVINGY